MCIRDRCIPGNLAIAVGEKIKYSRILLNNKNYWIASERLSELNDHEYQIIDESIGSDLIGGDYVPAYDEFENEYSNGAFRIIHSDDTNTDSGSGLVSQAPAYGESDFYALKKGGINAIVDPVTLSGKFDSSVKGLENKYVKAVSYTHLTLPTKRIV